MQEVNPKEFDYQNSATSTPPAKQLWQAVLVQAIAEANGSKPCGEVALKHNQELAINYILEAGKDFRTVCDLAGFDPDFIRDAFTAGRLVEVGRRFRGKVTQRQSQKVAVRARLNHVERWKG